MRFTIGSAVYDMQSLDRLTLLQILRLERELKELRGEDMKWAQIRAMCSEIDELDGDEQEDHPDFMWVVALGIWASRLGKGEDLAFADAIDFPIGDLTFVPDPEDHKPGKAQRHKGGAEAGNSPATKAAKKTSAPRSSPAS